MYELTAPPFFGPEAAGLETRLALDAELMLELDEEEEPVLARRRN